MTCVTGAGHPPAGASHHGPVMFLALREIRRSLVRFALLARRLRAAVPRALPARALQNVLVLSLAVAIRHLSEPTIVTAP